jgi:hypothetical protein
MRHDHTRTGAAGEEECYAIPESRAACANRWNDTALFPEARLLLLLLLPVIACAAACYCLLLDLAADTRCTRVFDEYGSPFAHRSKTKCLHQWN